MSNAMAMLIITSGPLVCAEGHSDVTAPGPTSMGAAWYGYVILRV